MPIYSYQCDACGNQFDARESFSAPSVRDCTCGERQTARRIIQPVGIIYKGSGFYTTDYARKGSANGSNGSSPKSSSDSSSSDSTPSETKSSSTEGASKPATAGSDKT